MITMMGAFGGFLGPYVTGRLRDATHSFAGGLYLMGGLALAAAMLALVARSGATGSTYCASREPCAMTIEVLRHLSESSVLVDRWLFRIVGLDFRCRRSALTWKPYGAMFFLEEFAFQRQRVFFVDHRLPANAHISRAFLPPALGTMMKTTPPGFRALAKNSKISLSESRCSRTWEAKIPSTDWRGNLLQVVELVQNFYA